ncbi:MAG: RluA family pseudouridine synthase [Verrucomicrobiota bacterium]|nr:RluA family pseudouridine synthase [Verrucomicrobiota bacterium]
MQQKKPFKQPPRKFHPKGLTILYEDWDIVVVDKVSGLLTVANETVRENTAHYLLNEYVRKGNSKSKNRVYIVHRLDRYTSGLLVFAKSEQAKKFLQDNWKDFKKKYYAVVRGCPKERKGVLTSYLAENSIHRMYSVSDPEKGKYAQTAYEVVKEASVHSLLEVRLHTGRKNQIRVHMADIGCPVAGDKKYGVKDKGVRRLCLHATSLMLMHPFSKEKMTFESPMPSYFNNVMNKTIEVAKKNQRRK